jgi:hypothetical protein
VRKRSSATTRDVITTIVCGYVVFLAIVVLFHVVLAGQHNALVSAAVGGGFPLLGATAVYAVCLGTRGRITGVRSGREGGRADEGDGLENDGRRSWRVAISRSVLR